MHIPRPERLGNLAPVPTARRIEVFAIGLATALLQITLLVVLSLVVDLLVSEPPGVTVGGIEAASDSGLTRTGQWLRGRLPGLRTGEWWLAAVVGTSLTVVLAHCLTRYWLARSIVEIVAEAATDVRAMVQRQTLRLDGGVSQAEIDREAMDLVDGQVEILREQTVRVWSTVAGAWALVPLSIAVGLVIHAWLTLAAVLLVVPCGFLLGRVIERAAGRHRLYTDRAEQEMSLVGDALSQGALASKYRLGGPPEGAFSERLPRHHRAVLARDLSELIVAPATRFVLLTSGLLVLFLAGINILRLPPRITVAETTLLFSALACAGPAALAVARLRHTAPVVERAVRRIADFLDREPELAELPSADPVDRLSRSLNFEAVTLVDPAGRTVLEEISLEIPAHSRVAVVSSDGRVAKALARLVLRFIDPTSGRVLLDDRDIRLVTLDSLRGQIDVVRDVVRDGGGLFTGTVADNIRYGDERFSLSHVTEFAKRAGAYGFIQRLPQGFSTIIGSGGLRLDASERYRIGLARALLRDPAIVILEEPLEGIEPETGEQIDEATEQVAVDRTVIHLAPRLSSLRTADRIFVFREGRLEAEGNHAELLRHSDLYRHLHYLQFNAFRDTVISSPEAR